MSEESNFQVLRNRDALVDVEQGGLVILKSADDQRAIRAQLVKGDHCFVLMGTHFVLHYKYNPWTVEGKPHNSVTVHYTVRPGITIRTYVRRCGLER
jgi:hypothetical protein